MEQLVSSYLDQATQVLSSNLVGAVFGGIIIVAGILTRLDKKFRN